MSCLLCLICDQSYNAKVSSLIDNFIPHSIQLNTFPWLLGDFESKWAHLFILFSNLPCLGVKFTNFFYIKPIGKSLFVFVKSLIAIYKKIRDFHRGQFKKNAL